MLLLLCVLLPWALGGVLLMMKGASARGLGAAACAGAALTAALALYLTFTPGDHAFSLAFFTLKLDGPGRHLFALTAALYPFAVLFAADFMRKKPRPRAFFALYGAAFGAILLLGCAGDLAGLLLGYALTAAACLPLLRFEGGEDGQKAFRWGVVSLAAGFLLALISVIGLESLGWHGFRSGGAAPGDAGGAALPVLFGCLGFGALMGLLPLTGWLAKATLSPAPVSALLHAVAGSAGLIGVMRLLYDLLPADGLSSWVPLTLLGAALATSLWGEARMLRTADVEMRMAYSSVSNYAFMVMSLALMTGQGVAAALNHMTAHALAKMILFICTGIILEETGCIHVRDMHGLGRRLPWTFAFFTLAGLSLMGIPPLPGFVSKYALITAAFHQGGFWQHVGAVVMALSSVFTAIDIFIVVFPAFCLPCEQTGVTGGDCGWKGKAALLALGVMLLAAAALAGPLMRDAAGIGEGVRSL